MKRTLVAALFTFAAVDAGSLRFALDQQIDSGPFPAIGPLGKFNGRSLISFENEHGVGFTRRHLITGMGPWYNLWIDLENAGIGPIDLSHVGATIEFDARYFQDNANYPSGTRWDQQDAVIGVFLFDGSLRAIVYEFVYRSYPVQGRPGDPPYPTWTKVKLNVHSPELPVTNVFRTSGFDFRDVVEMGFLGTLGSSTGADFVDFKELVVTGITAPIPEPGTLAQFAVAAAVGVLLFGRQAQRAHRRKNF